MNGLKGGGRSRLFENFVRAMHTSPPCSVDRTAAAVLTPEQSRHPLFTEMVDLFRQAEIDIVSDIRWERARREARKRIFYATEAGM
jgi:hypothetical protein